MPAVAPVTRQTFPSIDGCNSDWDMVEFTRLERFARPSLRVAAGTFDREGGQADRHVLSPVGFRGAVPDPFTLANEDCLAGADVHRAFPVLHAQEATEDQRI